MAEDLNGNLFDPESANKRLDKANEMVESLGDVLVDSKSNKAMFGNDTLAKKIDSLTDFSGIKNPTTPETTKYNGGGVYNTMQNGLGNSSRESAADTASSAIKDSDAYQGYSNVRHGMELIGIKPIGSGSASSALNHMMTSKKNAAFGIVGENGQTYGIGTHIYGNTLDNYRRNVNDIDRYLKDHGINANNLNNKEIKNALNSGKLGQKVLTQDEKRVLSQKLYFDKYKNIAQKAQANKFMTTKARAKAAVKDSDAYKGYKTTTTMVKTVKTGLKLTRVTTGVGLNVLSATVTTPTKIVSQGGKIASKGVGKVASKVQAKTGSKVAGKVIAKSEKINVGFSKVNVVARNTQKKVNIAAGEVRKGTVIKTLWGKSPVGKFVNKRVGILKRKITNSKIAIFRRNLIDKWNSKFSVRAFRFIKNKYSKLIDFFERIKLKLLLFIGGIILAIVGIAFLGTAVAVFLSNSTEDSPLDIAGCMQTAIDTINEYQLAYETNIWNYVEDSEFAEKGVPQAWNLEESEETQGFLITDSVVQRPAENRNYTINKEGIKFEGSFGKLMGYNLAHYWGKETFEYFAEVPIYTEIMDYNADGSIRYDCIPTGETQLVSVIGEAGICSYINNGIDMELSELNGYVIPYTDSSYLARDEKYNEINKEYEYLGTEKVEFANFAEEYPECNHESNTYSFGFTSPSTGSFDTAAYDIKPEVKEMLNGNADANMYTYDKKAYYKSICSLTAAVAENASDLNEISPRSATNFFGNYSKNVFDTTVETSEALLEVEYTISPDDTLCVNTVQHFEHTDANVLVIFPMVQPEFNLKTTYYNAGMADMANLDTGREIIDDFIDKTKHFYTTYEFPGWWDVSDSSMTENYIYALDVYGFTDEDFDALYEGVVFPTEFASVLSQAEIDEIINQIKLDLGGLTEEQERAINIALSLVGTTHYGYGGAGGGLDCSGFITKVMREAGVKGFVGGSCAGILNNNPHSNFNHSINSLQPGDLLIKNSAYGGETSSENHIVMYIGNGSFVECTTYKGVSGPQVNSLENQPQRVNHIINEYKYIIKASDIY